MFRHENVLFRKKMLASPVMIPIEENILFDKHLEKFKLVSIKYYQLRTRLAQMAVSNLGKVNFRESEDGSDEQHLECNNLKIRRHGPLTKNLN